MMETNDVLQAIRLLSHVVTVIFVASYLPGPGSRRRHGVSLFAAMLAAMSAGLGCSTALNWGDWLALPLSAQVLLTLIFSLITVPVIAGRGNVASLFPDRHWGHRP